MVGTRRPVSIFVESPLLAILFVAMLLLDSMAAYTIAGVPVPFLAYACAAGGLFLSADRVGIRIPPGSGLFAGMITLALLVQFLGIAQEGTHSMTRLATTDYPLFIFTRYVNLV